MASMRIYCDCKVHEIGTANLDMYKLPWTIIEQLLLGTAKCKHCGQLLKYVGKQMTERKADKIDNQIKVGE
jgi:hypothetical protein